MSVCSVVKMKSTINNDHNMTENNPAGRREIFSWAMYDFANSGFATTILAGVLPVYYSQVAGSTLPSGIM